MVHILNFVVLWGVSLLYMAYYLDMSTYTNKTRQ